MGRSLLIIILIVVLATSAISIEQKLQTWVTASGQSIVKHYVIAFLPYWTISGYEPGFDVDRIIFFDAPVNSDGSIDTGNIDNYYSEITRVNDSCGGCLLGVALTCFDPDSIDEILAYHRSTLISQAVDLAEKYGFREVNIDFENMRDTNSLTGQDNSDLLLALIQGLKDNGLNVSIDVSGGVPTVYRDSRLGGVVDYVFMMGYDFHWSTAPQTGPVSPLESPLEFSVEDGLAILDDYYPKDKIILGLPLYGYDWPAETCDPYSDTTGTGTALKYSTIKNNYEQYGVKWDPNGHVPYITYIDDSTCRQVWYDNATSLAMKIDYALIHGYAGYGFWALGYEDGAGDEELLGEVFDSRRVDPYIEKLGVYVDGNKLVINASGMINVEELNITLKLTIAPGQVNYTLGDLGVLFNDSSVESGDAYINISLRRRDFPGLGVSGSGLLLNISTEWEVYVENATVSIGSWRIPPGEETIVEGVVGNITVNPPPPIPEASGLSLVLLIYAGLAASYIFFKWFSRGKKD